MDEGVLRFIAKAYLLLHSGPSDPARSSPDKMHQKKRQPLRHGRLVNNGKLNADKNQHEKEPDR
jgi:hypothetical protein